MPAASAAVRDSTFGASSLAVAQFDTTHDNVVGDLLWQNEEGVHLRVDGGKLYSLASAIMATSAEAALSLDHAVLWYHDGHLQATKIVNGTVDLARIAARVRPPHSAPGAMTLLLSGGELWAVNRSCVVGLFSGLSGCADGWDVASPAHAAATHTELFLMDATTGNVAGFPHATGMNGDLAAFFAKFARPWANDPPRAQLQPNVLLPPRLAAQPLKGFGVAQGVSVRNGRLVRAFATAELAFNVSSALPPVTSERAWAHWSAGDECGAPEICPFSFYCAEPPCTNASRCLAPRNMCDRATRNTDRADTRCATPTPATTTCPNGYVVTEACGKDAVQYFAKCSGTYRGRPRCLPRPTCAIYNPDSNRCVAPLATTATKVEPHRARRSTPQCAIPTVAPVAGPTAPPITVCGPDEFLAGDLCKTCSLCPAGTRLKTPCVDSQVVCADCKPGEYMDLPWHDIDHCKLQRYPRCPGASRFSDGTCPSLRWFAEHWYYGLYLASIMYTWWGVRYK